MASSIDFVNFICEQISGAGIITNKKMFGEYLVYCNGKPVILICDDTAFVKIIDAIKDIVGNAEQGYPYNGAKLHYIIDNTEDRDYLAELVTAVEKVTPLPKPKKKKDTKG